MVFEMPLRLFESGQKFSNSSQTSPKPGDNGLEKQNGEFPLGFVHLLRGYVLGHSRNTLVRAENLLKMNPA